MENKEHPEPWTDFPEIWKSKAAWFTWLRGLLRRGWSKSPVKIKFLQRHRYKIPNPTGKGKKIVWGGDCEICKKTFTMKDLQVDHKVAAGSLQDYSDIEGFVTRLLAVTEDDLQLVCKPCHTIITHTQKTGLSFDDAKREKQIIEKCKKKVAEQKKELLASGFKEEDISNATKRREAYGKLLRGEVDA